MPASNRGGFALVAVLWVVVAVGALALVARLAARDAVSTAGNRVELARARWAAEGCAELARARVDRALREAGNEGPFGTTWASLDHIVAESLNRTGCGAELRPMGVTLNANQADAATIRRLLLAAGASGMQADSLVDALLDWRDADDDPRPLGAERASYPSGARPRNGLFADRREVLRVRGMAALSGVDTLLGVDPTRVALSHAPFAVLASLPGMTPEAASRVLEMRAQGEWLSEVAMLEGRLSVEARQELLQGLPVLSGLITTQPDAWLLLSRGRSGAPPVTVWMELVLVRAGARAAVVRRRNWIE